MTRHPTLAGALTVVAVCGVAAYAVYRARPDLMESASLAVAVAVGGCCAGHAVRWALLKARRTP